MEFTIDFFNIISDFGDEWVIKGLETDVLKKEVYIDLEYGLDKYYDPKTEVEVKIYDHSPQRVWRHLDVWDYKTYVRCSVPRVTCEDGQILTIRYGWSGPHDRHTYSFEIRAIQVLLATKNQTKSAELLGCTFRLINRIMHRSTTRGIERRNLEPNRFGNLSIDEKSFQKGHKYVSVISDPITGCVLDVGEGRDYQSVKEMLTSLLSTDQLKYVKTISMDMWKAYIKAANTLMPEAEIVHDRFHLVKYLNEVIDKVRRREVGGNEILKKSRYALLKNAENRTTKQESLFNEIMNTNLEVTQAFYAKETFKSLFDRHHDDSLIKTNLIAWADEFYRLGIKELQPVILRMLGHIDGVVNAMISSFTNAMAERLNGKIQEIKLSGRGYRKFENFRSAILFFHGKLNLIPLKW